MTSHQGGLWEFPGGKIENNESVLDALKRELFEEIGIALTHASPLIRIQHDYDDKTVLLDVWQVDDFTGEPFGKEGQATCWIRQDELPMYDFPAANIPILMAIQLPDKYMITGKFTDEEDLLNRIQSGLEKGIKLIQFRAYDLSEDAYFSYAKNIYPICEQAHAKLLLNTSIKNYKIYKAYEFSHGIHLNSKEMKLLSPDDNFANLLVSASTHNEEELSVAEKNNVDFIVLSPVHKTASHPNTEPLGWVKFNQLTDKTNIPAYALGGMTENDLIIAKDKGAQGIAAIGYFWDE